MFNVFDTGKYVAAEFDRRLTPLVCMMFGVNGGEHNGASPNQS